MQEELLRLQGVLRKTIIFITHDFDEAIRLADRIAIMQDGEIIQSGTPEELVLHPATGYVAEFTRDVQRSKVMSARRIMEPLREPHGRIGGKVAADAKVASFAGPIIAARKPFLVFDKGGRSLGMVTPEAVIDLLAGGERTQRQ
jgi:glycine betaine/proline transport system ATP-binding protein